VRVGLLDDLTQERQQFLQQRILQGDQACLIAQCSYLIASLVTDLALLRPLGTRDGRQLALLCRNLLFGHFGGVVQLLLP